MLKNFQLKYTPNALRAEADAWRVVVHLNLVRSVNFILDILSNPAHAAAGSNSTYRPSGSSDLSAGAGSASAGFGNEASPVAGSFAGHRSSAVPPAGGESAGVRRYKLALSPLRQVEMILARQLSAHEVGQPVSPAAAATATADGTRAPDVAVRGGRGWMTMLLKRRAQQADEREARGVEELKDARRILDACKTDIVRLWESPGVRAALRDAGVELQEQSGLCVILSWWFFGDVLTSCAWDSFLDQATRVADARYEPTFGMSFVLGVSNLSTNQLFVACR